ncbi:MAG: hypothetical protein Fur006_58350 [Coleofasciculaceae cyanobacterium]
MIGKCLLETDGYQVLFQLKHLDTSKEYFDAVIELMLDPHLTEVSLKSVPTFIAISDLQELVTYFDRHIARLQQNPSSESDTFVPKELGFQVKALSGEIISPTEGEFSLLFMVNVGRSNEEVSSTYFGGESEVTLENIQKFKSSVQASLVELSARLAFKLYV